MKGPHCGGCPLHTLGTGFASGIKTNPSMPLGVLIVLESLGEKEAERSEYACGPTGDYLNRLISRTRHPITGAPLDRSMFGVENTVHCRPPGDNLWNKQWSYAFEHCRPYLTKSLDDSEPQRRVILGMGAGPLRWFTGKTNIERSRGYVYETQWGYFIPTFHPAYLLRGKAQLSKVVQCDIAKAVQVAAQGLERAPLDAILFPTPAQGQDFLDRYKAAGCPPLSCDIETPYSTKRDEEAVAEWDDEEEASEFIGYDKEDPSYRVVRISFAFEEDRGITFEWRHPFTEIARELLALGGEKIFWNQAYDVPRLEQAGYPVNGIIHDGMLYFARLEPGLPKSLAFVSSLYTDLPEWKSEAQSRPEFYSVLDAVAALRNTNKIIAGLKEKGMWEVAYRHIALLYQALQRASRRGVNVDRERRAKSRADFEQRHLLALAEIQQHIPREILPTTLYKARPSVFRKAAAKKGWDLEDGSWEETWVEVPLRAGWMVGEDGEECKIPKPPKPKKEKKPKSPRKRRGKSLPALDTGQTSLEGTEPTPLLDSAGSLKEPS